MMKELIKNIIKDFHKKGLPKYRERDFDIPLDTGKIISLIGPRRAGKTFLMYQLIDKIKDITNVIYINFEDERLDFDAKDLNKIIEAYLELYPRKNERDLFFFFDEIQEVSEWYKFVRRVYDQISKKIFITGSSAKLLSKEIATSLRGRAITYEVFPLSFKEYLSFRGVEKDVHSTKGKAMVKDEFKDYLKNGAFPETVGMKEEIREKTLRSYFDVMLYRDIAERYSVGNMTALKEFLKRLIANSSKNFSVNKLFNELKSQRIKVSKDSLYKFLDYFEDAYIVFNLNNFKDSAKIEGQGKAYSIDTGLSRLLSYSLSKDLGRMLENIVMLSLRRREEEIYYYKDKKECDFVIKERDRIVEAIQVCHELNEENREREIKGLKEAMKRFNLEEGLILTYNQKESFGNIKVIPVAEWLV